jgi:hypothetical protein
VNYGVHPDPYAYPNSSVLKNRAGLRNAADLDRFATVLTAAATADGRSMVVRELACSRCGCPPHPRDLGSGQPERLARLFELATLLADTVAAAQNPCESPGFDQTPKLLWLQGTPSFGMVRPLVEPEWGRAASG